MTSPLQACSEVALEGPKQGEPSHPNQSPADFLFPCPLPCRGFLDRLPDDHILISAAALGSLLSHYPLPMVVTTVPAKKKLLLKSQLLGLVELPLGFTPFTQASMMTCGECVGGHCAPAVTRLSARGGSVLSRLMIYEGSEWLRCPRSLDPKSTCVRTGSGGCFWKGLLGTTRKPQSLGAGWDGDLCLLSLQGSWWLLWWPSSDTFHQGPAGRRVCAGVRHGA